MFCPSCGAAVKSGQRFCTSCGIALVDTSVHQTTEALPTLTPLAPQAAAPAATPTLPPPTMPAAPPAASPTLPLSTVPAAASPFTPAGAAETTALTVVEQTAHTATADVWAAADAATGQLPSTVPSPLMPTSAWPVVDGPDTDSIDITNDLAAGPQAFRLTPLVGVAAVAAVLAVATAFLDVATIEVSGDTAGLSTYKLNDFASNYTVGAIIAAVLMVGGAAIGATGRRFGTGLAGGAGLALAGMMSFMIGQVIAWFDASEVGLMQGGGAFTLTTTQEIGFWLAVTAAVLGVVAFVLSLSDKGDDGRAQVPEVVTILGAVATLLVVVGSLIPGKGAEFADQFANDFTPPATLLLRLLVFVLIAVGGIVGFVAGRRWGLGMALGAISVGVWQWITALTESGDFPFGIGGGNYGATDYTPHVITTVGVALMLLAIVGGLLMKPRSTAS
ncbi:MAG TPA: zinc ribbon domain-containing protein [Ilumatobacteraceae bacterium]|nr:zinc ribbon domain-containing protein [Ilumatobacteraceae bacterium]